MIVLASNILVVLTVSFRGITPFMTSYCVNQRAAAFSPAIASAESTEAEREKKTFSEGKLFFVENRNTLTSS